jgi:RNA polymerase sigma-54 factor
MPRIGFSQRLALRQTQALVMTPQLQQAIKMLQLSNLELADLVAAEIERNPLLERNEGGALEQPEERDGAASSAAALEEAGPPSDAAEYWRAGSAEEGDGSIDFGGSFSARGRGSRSFDADDLPSPEQNATRPRTLREHLLEQIGPDFSDPGDRLIALHLLDLLDEAGYLRGAIEEVATRLGCDDGRVAAVLARLQQLDPPGVFARSLEECLALQLRDRNRLDPAMQSLLDNLPLLASRSIAALLRACGVDAEDLSLMVAEIRSLDPRPGHAFDPPLAQPVVPDLLMRGGPAGAWLIEINAETLPRVLVNRQYYVRVSRAARHDAEREYLAEQLHAANWLVKALHQRAVTILKVAAEIVRQQDAFFRHGVRALRPLVLRDIAEAIGLHESTVSRVTTNKYIATPRGLYELKYFFSSSIAGAEGGEAHSAEAVRFHIKSLIDAEPAEEPLSDERIVEILGREGIDIARRTVAKYREAMRIASSLQRRREKLFVL